MTVASEHALSCQLNAGAIDAKAGVIKGATVAQAGVEATGKFILVDKEGNLTRDPKLAARKLRVVTDDKTLETIMAAAQDAGGVLKVRSDHDDTLESRAGYADNFQKIPASTTGGKFVAGRIVADLHLNDSYRDRDIVLETAAKTPKLIGLSIDMNPSFEIFKDSALMRVEELLAVDIVDEGAITHDGIFLNRGVDKTPKLKPSAQPSNNMAADPEKKDLTVADCMTAIAELTKGMTALQVAVGKMAAPVVPDKDGDQMAAALKETNEKLAALTETTATIRKEQAALGLKVGGAAPAGDETEKERLRLAAEKEAGEKKGYLDLVEEAAAANKDALASGKMRRSDIHQKVMSENPEKYSAYQKGLGIYDPARDPARMKMKS